MDECIYRKNEVVNGIRHEFCSNEERKKISNSHVNHIPCMCEGCKYLKEVKQVE